MGERSEYQGEGLGLVDDKGRVAIPVSLRVALAANSPRPDGKDGGSVVVGVHPEQQCLRAYDPGYVAVLKAEAELLQARYLAEHGKPNFNLKRRYAQGELTPFDGSGRFIMSGFQREYANIGENAFFLGTFDWIEIWDPKTLLEADDVDAAIQAACRYYCKAKGIVL